MKILVANDGSEFGDAAVAAAADLVDTTRETHVKVVTVVVPDAVSDVERFIETAHHLDNVADPLVRHAEEVGTRSAEYLNSRLAGTGVVITREVLAGSAARAIVEKAEHWHADLIVVGSHGHGVWKRTLVGSVSNLVIHHAPCSVFVVRQKLKT